MYVHFHTLHAPQPSLTDQVVMVVIDDLWWFRMVMNKAFVIDKPRLSVRRVCASTHSN